MLDLIIPVYKNKKGLYRTLMSIGTQVSDKVKVTIVDDYSEENYSELIELFQKIIPIRILYLKKNSGPGIARQYGLENSKEEYVSFIDCGDTFLTPTTLKEMIDEVEKKPEFQVFSWAHLEELTNRENETILIDSNHNRMHGKIYKRVFLEKHQISFSKEGSRANEDIGFNQAIRIINKVIYNNSIIAHYDNPAVVWKKEGPSIVRENDCAYNFKKQNLGYAINAKHVIDILRKNNITKEQFQDYLYIGMAVCYISYLATLAARREFLEESLAGAFYYYKEIFLKNLTEINPVEMKDFFFSILTAQMTNPYDPIRAQLLPIDYAGFLNYLQELLEKEQSIEEG